MMRLFSGRKGIMFFNFLVMIPRILFLVIMLIVCVILIRMFLNDKFNINDVQAEILIDGLIYGTGGVSYYDPVTGRLYPEIIDISQLDGAKLDQGLFYPENHMMTARILVEKPITEYTDMSLMDRYFRGEDPKFLTLKDVYYNKVWYDNWEPLLVFKNLGGIGGVIDKNMRLPVLVREPDGTLMTAYVNFQVVQPKALRSR
jgi:hypothetical protein